jgi:hypothetical protein
MMNRYQTLLSIPTCAATPWDRRTIEAAHASGRADIIQYVTANECPSEVLWVSDSDDDDDDDDDTDADYDDFDFDEYDVLEHEFEAEFTAEEDAYY